MSISNKIAYLKGVVDTIEISDRNTEKVLKLIASILEDIANEVEFIGDEINDIGEDLDAAFYWLDDIDKAINDADDSEFFYYGDNEGLEKSDIDDTKCGSEPEDQDHNETDETDENKDKADAYMIICPRCGSYKTIKAECIDTLDYDDALVVICDNCGADVGICLAEE